MYDSEMDAMIRELKAENERLREALEGIALAESYVDSNNLWDYRPAMKKREMWNIARAALEGK